MKKFTKQKAVKMAAFLIAILFIFGCSRGSQELYEQARVEIEKGHYRIGLDILEKAIASENQNEIKAKYLIESSRVARFEILDFERAIRYLREVVRLATKPQQRTEAQQSIAEIYFEDLQNYELALKELQILEPREQDPLRKLNIQLKIAQCFYYRAEYSQALEQIETVEKNKTFLPSFSKLKAQVYLAQKRFFDSRLEYEKISSRDPDFFDKEKLYSAMAVAYEEDELYSEAIKYLKKNEDKIADKNYLLLRYKRLEEKQKNKPMSKGMKK